jgi:hypothetical protein
MTDIPDSKWSGGFMLDKDSSFHINIRSTYSYSAFIRCQVTLRGATYDVILSDAASSPPPHHHHHHHFCMARDIEGYGVGVRAMVLGGESNGVGVRAMVLE